MGGENEELLFNRYRASVCKDQSILEMDSGDVTVAINMNVLKDTKLYT